MRPVYIVLQGSSANELKQYEDRIPDNALICGVNDCFQNPILSRKFDFIHYSADDEQLFYATSRELLKYCDKTGCEVITSKDKKERFFNSDNVIVSEYATGNSHFCEHKYNSLTAIILFMCNIGRREFILFGADGKGGLRDKSYRLDSEVMNKYFWDEVNRCGFTGVTVVNVNNDSAVNCFKTMRYTEFFA